MNKTLTKSINVTDLLSEYIIIMRLAVASDNRRGCIHLYSLASPSSVKICTVNTVVRFARYGSKITAHTSAEQPPSLANILDFSNPTTVSANGA